jgi:hypothetical protein
VQSDLGPKLDALVAAVSKPSPELGSKLEALRVAVLELGKSMGKAGSSAPQIDLTPYLEKLSEAVRVPVAAPQMDLGPVLQQLAANAKAQSQSSETEGAFREEVAMQMLLIQERLSELALAARTVLQGDSDGSVKAMTVWQHTKEALELLKALPSRGRKPRAR